MTVDLVLEHLSALCTLNHLNIALIIGKNQDDKQHCRIDEFDK